MLGEGGFWTGPLVSLRTGRSRRALSFRAGSSAGGAYLCKRQRRRLRNGRADACGPDAGGVGRPTISKKARASLVDPPGSVSCDCVGRLVSLFPAGTPPDGLRLRSKEATGEVREGITAPKAS